MFPSPNAGTTTSDMLKFATDRPGHARVWLIPHLMRTVNTSVLYLDNDTILTNQSGDALWKTLVDQNRSGQKCFAYELESGCCGKLLGPAIGDLRGSADKQNVRVRNNGVIYIPNTSTGLRIAEEIKSTYEALPCASSQRYLHDMVALSLVWAANPEHCSTLLPAATNGENVRPLIVHYWAEKTKPHLQSRFLANIAQWRLEEDISLLYEDTRASSSEKTLSQLAERVLENARTDARDLIVAAKERGVFLNNQSQEHLSNRTAMRSTLRIRSEAIQPSSKKIYNARQRAQHRLRHMLM